MPKPRDPDVETLDAALKDRTMPGELYERLEGERVRCTSCGHRCLIPEGRDGICRVRFNRGGTLHVPRGYVAGLQVDPIEKKPFFHAFPGGTALSFGMLGCDLHCGYCFTPGTRVQTSLGNRRIEELYQAAADLAGAEDEAVAAADGLEIRTHTGTSRRAVQVFSHRHSGPMIRIQPQGLPAIEATPDHPFLTTRVSSKAATPSEPTFVPAKDLARADMLFVPRRFSGGETVVLSSVDLLRPHVQPFTVRHSSIGTEVLSRIRDLTAEGISSAEIGRRLGLGASHVRHLRSRVARGEWNLESLETKTGTLVEMDDRVRFSKEHAPGIPARIPLEPDLAWLLGIYCAEGSIQRPKNRRNTASVVFSFGRHEEALVERAIEKLIGVFGVAPYVSIQRTTTAVILSKSSAAILFEVLCGSGSRKKRVPDVMFRVAPEVVRSFLDAYVSGDGHRRADGMVTVLTVSEELAAGVAALVQGLGFLPRWYAYDQPARREIEGREVCQSPRVYHVRWREDGALPRGASSTPTHFLVPIREVATFEYDGPVYNLEVEGEHTYLANGVAVHNCQNWLTSQALRDSAALVAPRDVSAAEIVEIAKRHRAPAMVSTYNEPLITSEWAVEVFRLAREAGIVCGYVSNGNGTREVLEYLRPWVDLYKVDLKSFRDASYRELGGTLENVLETIRNLWSMGFWLEIVTLVVPGFNSSEEELRDLARFLASVSVDIPWHVTAFHKDYRMQDHDSTSYRDLLRAATIGREEGLRYVYAGNLPGSVGDFENTRCPGCDGLVVERRGYRILSYRLTGAGTCPDCGERIAGFWRSGWRIPADGGGLPDRRPRAVSLVDRTPRRR